MKTKDASENRKRVRYWGLYLHMQAGQQAPSNAVWQMIFDECTRH